MIKLESRRPEPLRRLAHKTAEIIPMSWIRPAALMRVDRGMFRLDRSHASISALASGLPIVMLTTTGARTGELRTLPVLALPVDDRDLDRFQLRSPRPTRAGLQPARPAVRHDHLERLLGHDACAELTGDSGSAISTWVSRPIHGGSSTTDVLRAATAGDHARAALRSRRPMILAPVRLTWPHVLVSTEVECVARCRQRASR